jgi:hypothetical protein
MYNIKAVVENIIDGVGSDREKAIKIHDFVRDKVRFGIAKRLDFATPEDVIDTGYGHSCSKTTLFVRLLREAGINAMHHFVTMKKDYLYGAFPDAFYLIIPENITHCYTEVILEGKHYHLDSYIVERNLFEKMQFHCKEQDKIFGYGINYYGNTEWNGFSDCFSQFHPSLVLEDHGSFENPFDFYYEYPAYTNQFLGIQFSFIMDFLASFTKGYFEIWVNSILNHYRSY